MNSNVKTEVWLQLRLKDLKLSLLALSALIESGSKDLSFNEDECYGLGCLLRMLSDEVSRLEVVQTLETSE